MSIVPGAAQYNFTPPNGNFTTTAAGKLSADRAAAVDKRVADPKTTTQPTTGAPSQFETILSSLVPSGQQKNIDEEKLFSALIEERLTTQKGPQAATTYHQRLDGYRKTMARSDGYIPEEDAARAALKDLVKEKVLTTVEAEKLHAQAFKAAQLDSDTDALYDGMGSTMAVTLVNLALKSSSEKMARFDSGKEDAGRMSLDYVQGGTPAPGGGHEISGPAAPKGGDFKGGGGFLFKPVSESNGKLVILLPKSMTGNVADVNILDSSGQRIETGDNKGIYEDGRPIFRFDRSGRQYPEHIVVAVALKDGGTKEYNIPNPSQRYE